MLFSISARWMPEIPDAAENAMPFLSISNPVTAVRSIRRPLALVGGAVLLFSSPLASPPVALADSEAVLGECALRGGEREGGRAGCRFDAPIDRATSVRGGGLGSFAASAGSRGLSDSAFSASVDVEECMERAIRAGLAYASSVTVCRELFGFMDRLGLEICEAPEKP
ncbi:MAG: hypothetical protein ACX98W_00270 [bacterium]